MADYGHNPYGAMFACESCGQRFRTVERLRAHQDDPEQRQVCQEVAFWSAQRRHGAPGHSCVECTTREEGRNR